MTKKYLNPDDFYAKEMDSWELYWDEGKSLYENVLALVSTSVFLPEPKILNPLVSVYILMPSKWARVAAILFSFGDQGSGKSTYAMLANTLHGLTHTFSPTDTFASVRNALDMMRWIDPGTKTFEREGSILCWDNLHKETLIDDKKLYQLLLFGYNRATDRIQIAASDGGNKEFYVFCPKIISSIEPLHLYHEFVELRRRLIVIPHKRWERFTISEKKYYEGLDINTDRLELESINWLGISRKFYEFWSNENNCSMYVNFRGLLTKKGKREYSIPRVINGERWTISVDILTTGLVLGAWTDVQKAIDYMADYWKYADTYIYGEFNATLEHLRAFAEAETSSIREVNNEIAKVGGKTYPIVIITT